MPHAFKVEYAPGLGCVGKLTPEPTLALALAALDASPRGATGFVSSEARLALAQCRVPLTAVETVVLGDHLARLGRRSSKHAWDVDELLSTLECDGLPGIESHEDAPAVVHAWAAGARRDRRRVPGGTRGERHGSGVVAIPRRARGGGVRARRRGQSRGRVHGRVPIPRQVLRGVGQRARTPGRRGQPRRGRAHAEERAIRGEDGEMRLAVHVEGRSTGDARRRVPGGGVRRSNDGREGTARGLARAHGRVRPLGGASGAGEGGGRGGGLDGGAPSVGGVGDDGKRRRRGVRPGNLRRRRRRCRRRSLRRRRRSGGGVARATSLRARVRFTPGTRTRGPGRSRYLATSAFGAAIAAAGTARERSARRSSDGPPARVTIRSWKMRCCIPSTSPWCWWESSERCIAARTPRENARGQSPRSPPRTPNDRRGRERRFAPRRTR